MEQNIRVISDIKQFIQSFQKQLEPFKGIPYKSSSGETIQNIYNKFNSIANIVIQLGDQSNRQLDEFSKPEKIHFFIVYEWAEIAKSFLILGRNIIFQLQKGSIQLHEKIIDESSFSKLVIQSEKVFHDAFQVLTELPLHENKFYSDILNKLTKWETQTNPWKVYKKQMNTLVEQSANLITQHEMLLDVKTKFDRIQESYLTSISRYLETLRNLIENIEPLSQNLAKEENQFRGTKVISYLEKLHISEEQSFDNTIFNTELDQILSSLPNKTQISIDCADGILYFKEIDIRKLSSSWLESETMSSMYDFNNIKNGLDAKLKLTILNIKNRIEFEKQEGQSTTRNEISIALESLISTLDNSTLGIEKLRKHLHQKLKETLIISNIYSSDFMNLSMVSALHQYRRYKIEIWEQIKIWIREKASYLKQLKKQAIREEALSIPEKVVRSIRLRTPDPGNSHYTNMFLTRGYTGDSFCVGRYEEMERIKNLIENWKTGFRGALLITGTQFSGKSFLGTLTSNQYFNQNTIHIRPNQRINVGGRSVEAGYDLREVLDFVIKHSLLKPSMVWIDDLELWQNNQINVSKNANYLFNIIDQYSTRLFFAVSTSNWMRSQLNKFFEIERIFQSEINTNSMNFNDVKKAILIRHSATQMDLVNQNGSPLDAGELDKILKNLFKQSQGNIGEVLHKWAYTTHRYNEENVFINSRIDHPAPDFLNMNTSILLRAILMDRRTNEYLLRKKFGPAFKNVFQAILLRLFNLGILIRHFDGTFEINPFLVNEIASLLEKKLDFVYRNENLSEKDSIN